MVIIQTARQAGAALIWSTCGWCQTHTGRRPEKQTHLALFVKYAFINEHHNAANKLRSLYEGHSPLPV